MAQSPSYRVNELAHDADVTLDGSLAETYLKYAGLLVARGYVRAPPATWSFACRIRSTPKASAT